MSLCWGWLGRGGMGWISRTHSSHVLRVVCWGCVFHAASFVAVSTCILVANFFPPDSEKPVACDSNPKPLRIPALCTPRTNHQPTIDSLLTDQSSPFTPLHPRMAFGEAGHSGRLASVPANASPITYDVTMVDLQTAKEKWEMNGAEKVRGWHLLGRAEVVATLLRGWKGVALQSLSFTFKSNPHFCDQRLPPTSPPGGGGTCGQGQSTIDIPLEAPLRSPNPETLFPNTTPSTDPQAEAARVAKEDTSTSYNPSKPS